MVQELSYDTAIAVIDSWEVLRRKENYAEILGCGLLTKFFSEQPDAMGIFGIETESIEQQEEAFDRLLTSKHFLELARNYVALIDQAVDTLGPDLETLTQVLLELGDLHHQEYGIKPQWYPVLGRALLQSLEEILGKENFAPNIKACWLQVYEALTMAMTSSMVGKNVVCYDYHEEDYPSEDFSIQSMEARSRPQRQRCASYS